MISPVARRRPGSRVAEGRSLMDDAASLMPVGAERIPVRSGRRLPVREIEDLKFREVIAQRRFKKNQ